jgi:hypothetical protein
MAAREQRIAATIVATLRRPRRREGVATGARRGFLAVAEPFRLPMIELSVALCAPAAAPALLIKNG